MNTTQDKLATWIRNLIEDAKADTPTAVFWFNHEEYDDAKFCIVGGWSNGFSEEYNDILCISKSSPNYAMCVKIVHNDGPYAAPDFDSLGSPVNFDGGIEDLCIALDLDEDVNGLAQFLLTELERVSKECK